MEVIEIIHDSEIVSQEIINLIFEGSSIAMLMGFTTYLIGFCIMKIWNGIDNLISKF